MAMRAPEASGAGGDEQRAAEEHDPVLRAMMTCPVDDESIPESVQRIVDELGDEPHGDDHDTIVALIATLPE